MKRMVFAVLFLCSPVFGSSSDVLVRDSNFLNDPTSEHTMWAAQDFIGRSNVTRRDYTDESGSYVVEYVYGGVSWIPATYPAGAPHYEAMITVYKVEDGGATLRRIGDPFPGTYVENCYEDQPADVVKKALQGLRGTNGSPESPLH